MVCASFIVRGASFYTEVFLGRGDSVFDINKDLFKTKLIVKVVFVEVNFIFKDVCSNSLYQL